MSISAASTRCLFISFRIARTQSFVTIPMVLQLEATRCQPLLDSKQPALDVAPPSPRS